MKARLLGILVTAAILAGGFVFWRSTTGFEPGNAAAAKATRGGQLVASIRAVPRSFNRLVAREQTAELLSLLTQGRLVRINRATFELEPWLAEKWEASPDGRTYTLHLRPGVTWSDGEPFTSADVLFTLQAVFDPKTESVVAEQLTVGGKPITATAPDDHTVVLSYAAPSGPGLRLLDALAILPKHKLEGAVESRHVRQRLELGDAAGGHRRHRAVPAARVRARPTACPRPQPALLAQGGRRHAAAVPRSHRPAGGARPGRRAAAAAVGRHRHDAERAASRRLRGRAARRGSRQARRSWSLASAPTPMPSGSSSSPRRGRKTRASPSCSRPEFRQAISYAVDREAFAENVFLGAAVPIWGPITPGNKIWFSPNVLRYPHDVNKAKDVLKVDRPRRPQRQRHRRGRAGTRGALHGDHAARHRLVRARDQRAAEAAGAGRHRARDCAARQRRADQADAVVRLRGDLLPSADDGSRSGGQHGLLVEQRVRPLLEPGREDARDASGKRASTC